jgi:sulfate/thiosulfate transport system permease protein
MAEILTDKKDLIQTKLIRIALTVIAMLFIGVFLLIPLFTVFQYAFEKGLTVFVDAITEPEAVAAIRLTLLAASIAVFCNLLFGLSAAWLLTRFEFRGKSFFTSILDLPFTISPVISGMMFVLLFGANTLIGGFLDDYGIKIIFAVPGIVLVTMFVTFPYIARELIPLMNEIGKDEEEAALLLGANGWKMFLKVTLPNIKWSLLYGVILCSARAIGEFGAVSVVSGHIRGLTNTVPLHIEILYNEYNFTAAFAVASLLTLFALITLIVKSIIEWRVKDSI